MTPGQVLNGKYELLSELGDGGMGCVWRARDIRLDAPVAVKLMHAQLVGSADARSRFDREAKAAARVRSPHVVQVLDIGVEETRRTPFIVMELLSGQNLRERLARSGRMEPREVVRLVNHVARALTVAHDLGIVHRDLKPANIFLVRNAEATVAKVVDFGIAKWAAQPLQDASTETGMLLGTPYYMSPEQITSAKHVDFRADLWSLAVITVECLTGGLPFAADNLPGLIFAICGRRAAAPSSLGAVPRGLDSWFERATALDPAERFQSAEELALELRALCEAGPMLFQRTETLAPPPPRTLQETSVPPLSHTSTAVVQQRRRAWKRWVSAGAALLAVLLSTWALREVASRASASSALATSELPLTASPPAPIETPRAERSLSGEPPPETPHLETPALPEPTTAQPPTKDRTPTQPRENAREEKTETRAKPPAPAPKPKPPARPPITKPKPKPSPPYTWDTQ